MSYRQFQIDITPSPLRGPNGQAWAGGLGTQKDTLVARGKQAVYIGGVADPQGRGRETPSDGLSRLGADAQIERFSGESDDSYRARIAGAWGTWALAGTRRGIAYSVGLLGYGTPAVWSQRELPRPGPSTAWARMTLVFGGFEAWDGESAWDLFDWDARLVQGIESHNTAEVRAQLRRILRTWINARDHVTSVIIGFGTSLWDLDLWDGFSWDDGDASPVTLEAPDWDSDEAVWDALYFVWDYFV